MTGWCVGWWGWRGIRTPRTGRGAKIVLQILGYSGGGQCIVGENQECRLEAGGTGREENPKF